jgi:hypothetical protein
MVGVTTDTLVADVATDAVGVIMTWFARVVANVSSLACSAAWVMR